MNTQDQHAQHAQAHTQTETQPQPQAQPEPPPRSAAPPRVGKIARLPEAIREQLNLRLEAGEGGEALLEWLNQLPETQTLLEKEFGGKPINKQNLSDWRQGGFAEWSLRHELVDQAQATRSLAQELQGKSQSFLIDDLVLLFTARFAALLARWDGRVSPEFEAQARVFSRLRRDLLSLQKSAHWSARQQEEWERMELEREKRRKAELREKALGPLQAARRRKALAVNPGGEVGDRLNELLNIIDYGEPYPSYFATEPSECLDWVRMREEAWRAQEEEEETAEQEQAGDLEGEEAPDLSGAETEAASQGGEESAQAAEGETTNPQSTLPESRPVKPVSQAPSQGGLTGGSGGTGGKKGEEQKG